MRIRSAAIAIATAAALPHGAQAQEHPTSTLSWLAGCWASEGGEPGSGEQWMAPAGGTLLGVGRTVRRGATIEHEFLQIRTNVEGRLVYIARPSGQPEASFVATAVTEAAVTFENLEHDFPQRVSYRRIDRDRIAARIEGRRGGEMRAVDFPMQRTSCGIEAAPSTSR
jgi:Domain of unknown function (DUF6265)